MKKISARHLDNTALSRVVACMSIPALLGCYVLLVKVVYPVCKIAKDYPIESACTLGALVIVAYFVSISTSGTRYEKKLISIVREEATSVYVKSLFSYDIKQIANNTEAFIIIIKIHDIISSHSIVYESGNAFTVKQQSALQNAIESALLVDYISVLRHLYKAFVTYGGIDHKLTNNECTALRMVLQVCYYTCPSSYKC